MSTLQPVGLVGFGLMGQSIATCLMARGMAVRVYDSDRRTYARGQSNIEAALAELVRRRLLKAAVRKNWRQRLLCASSFDDFAPCPVVIESVPENLELKQQLFRELEAVVSKRAILASNTSSLPISMLQSTLEVPQRFVGMHWGVPSQLSPFFEVIPGNRTSRRTVTLAREFGVLCGKEAIVLREDIRGFIGNRLMYAMMREACYLVESGIADVATVDRAFRNDIGWWSLFAGPFRWMDLTGIPAYAAVMEGLFPKLSNQKALPEIMQEAVRGGWEGTANSKGFYRYDKANIARWNKAWIEFTYDLKALADKYEKLNRE
ncbi:MAG TPA: 3-hydroxyacyl-CoA dehydrogenase family protein [Bryobacteraceae bacterium]|jgi:3-hydroxybutyryl-CoA dehydrogenase